MAAYTATQLVTEALEEIQAISGGETLSAIDGAKALRVLNRMIEGQGIDRGLIYTSVIEQFPLAGGKQKYTMGKDPTSGSIADFDTMRPVRIDSANVLLTSGGSVVRRPLNLIGDGQWAAKAFQAVPGLPADLYNDGSYPFSILYLYPVPDQAYGLEIYSWQQFSQIATLAANILIPPGYYEFWVYGLAIRLAPVFGIQASSSTVQMHNEGRAIIRRMNSKAPRIASDDEAGTGLYNWRSGLEDT